MFIYRRIKKFDGKGDVFQFIKRVLLRDNPKFENICMDFHFKNPRSGYEPSTIIFAKMDGIIEFDFEKDRVKEIMTFEEPLHR